MRPDHAVVYPHPTGWRWRLTAPNGSFLAESSSSYKRRTIAMKQAARVCGPIVWSAPEEHGVVRGTR